MAIVFGFKGAMTPSSADEDVAESVGILLLLVLVFRVHTCCFLYKTQARGEKKMTKEEICSFFSHREREEPPLHFFYARITHTHNKTKKNEYVHPRVHRNAQSLQKSGRDHQRGGQGESAGTDFVHGRSRLGVLAHFPRRVFFCFLYRQKMVKA